ncbi:MAG TPA: ATP-binding cassette domain-containing protein [Steroidobacteraceae bacterium]
MSVSRRGPRLRSIRLDNVSVRYGRHWALRNLSFDIRSGERWLLTGPNGAGKTVLLKLLRGDVWPTPTGRERRCYTVGRAVHEQPALARERIAYLGPERQDRYERYEWNLPVVDVVATGLFETDIPLQQPSARQQRAVLEALRGVGLAGLAGRGFLTLSYGQRRRVLLARALVRKPDVLLLDEALNGLDANSRAAFMRALRRATQPHTAWVLSSHRRADIPAGVTHVARVEAGKLQAAGPLAELREALLASPSRPGKRGDRVLRPARIAGDDLVRLQRVAIYRDYCNVVATFDWTIRAGEHWCITGPNGSGKSTLLALLYGDLWPALGGVIDRPALAPGMPISEWKRLVGLVSPELQATYAATACTIEEIVLSGAYASIGLEGPPTRREIARARQVMQRTGLLALAGRKARQVSYGQLRLALFARALLLPRRLLLLDEPFDGLDAEVSARARDLVDAAARGGAQLVLATHHREDVPPYVANCLELRPGRRPQVISRR